MRLTFTKTNMLQNYNYSTKKILTEQSVCYRNANENTEQILKELQFRCISTMGKNAKPPQKGPRKASTAWSHVSKFGNLCREIFAGKEQYHKRTDTKHLTDWLGTSQTKHWERENCWLPQFTHDFLSSFRSGCDHYQQLKQNKTLILTWDQAQF